MASAALFDIPSRGELESSPFQPGSFDRPSKAGHVVGLEITQKCLGQASRKRRLRPLLALCVLKASNKTRDPQ